MKDTLTTEDVRTFNRKLTRIESMMEINDIVNRKTAIEILGIKSKTFSNYVSAGKIVVISRNAAGQAFFSRKQLLGLV